MGPVENVPGTEEKMAKNGKFLNLGPKGPWTKNLVLGSESLEINCRGPGKSIDTHIVRFCEKIDIFLNLGPMGTWTQNLAPGPKLSQI